MSGLTAADLQNYSHDPVAAARAEVETRRKQLAEAEAKLAEAEKPAPTPAEVAQAEKVRLQAQLAELDAQIKAELDKQKVADAAKFAIDTSSTEATPTDVSDAVKSGKPYAGGKIFA